MSNKGNIKILYEEDREKLNCEGFFATPFLSTSQINELTFLFHKHFVPEKLPDFFNTLTGSPNADVKRIIHFGILEICKPSIGKIFDNYFPVIAMFYAKKSGEKSELGLHNDPSMTMDGYNHLGVWMPLFNADESTGKMCFLSGTQNKIIPYHSVSIESQYKNILGVVKPIMKCIDVKMGEAVIFDNNLLHYTQKNLSGSIRIAAIIKLIDKNAPLVSAYCNSNSDFLELYEHNSDYYISNYFQEKSIPEKSIKLDVKIPKPPVFSLTDLKQVIE